MPTPFSPNWPRVATVNKPETRDDDEQFEDYGSCGVCGGEGYILVCIDDICHGLGYCIHGDGEVTCMACQGNG